MIKELSYVIAIAEKGNVSKAAESLFISQPSLSRYIKDLENRLGVQLFQRINNRLILTHAGENTWKRPKRLRKCTRTWRRIYPASTKSCPAACGWAARC